MFSHKLLIAGASILAVASVSCAAVDDAPARPSDPKVPVAAIEGKTVTGEELTSFAMQLEMTEGRRFSNTEGVLDEYILTRLYDKVPTTATIAKEKQETTSPTPYTSPAQRAMVKRELQKWMTQNLDVPRADLEDWYSKNVEKYVRPERVHAYHLFMQTAENDPTSPSSSADRETSSPDKVRARLKELKQQIDSGTSFSEMAEKYSEAASGKAGGEIGQITPRMPIGPLSKPMNIELETAFFSLKPFKVSDVVETKHGMHLLYITEKETTYTPTLDELVTSGILPGAVAQDRLTSQIRTMIAETREKYKGEAMPSPSQIVTTDTVAFRFDGKDYTIGSLTAVFGPRFSQFLETAKQDPDQMRELMGQALDDEVLLRVAIDKGVDKNPGLAKELSDLALREKARKRLDAIAEAEAKVTEEEIQAKYGQIMNELRQPEAAGYLITVKGEESSGTAEEARARETAHKGAEDLRKRLETMNIEDFVNSPMGPGAENTSVTKIAMHVIGQTTETEGRLFDQAIGSINGETGLSPVVPVGSAFLIAKLTERKPGEPLSLEVVRDRLAAMLQSEKATAVRREMVKRVEKLADIKYLPGAVSYGRNTDGSSAKTTTATE